ncbi:hypothetical protein C8F01DRAFT_1108105 [Mycena amicta]|nr:hypothetical protein C8F01DRAFT_1108105 [Mycena amicta]
MHLPWTASPMSSEIRQPGLSMLRQLFEAANSVKAKCESYLPSCAPPNIFSPKPDHDHEFSPATELPAPPSIIEKLIDLGLNSSLAENLSAKYNTGSEQLRCRTQAALLDACQQLRAQPRQSGMQKLMQKLVSEHQHAYSQGLRRLEEAALSLVDQLKASTSKKDDFNYDFLPYLETFFSHNCAPSKADQLVMAKKSGMSRKQIQVWFQNHRSRSRRQRGSTSDENAHTNTGPGMVVLRKMHPDDRARDVCLKEMEARLGDVYVVPEALRQQAGDDVYANAIKGLWDGELQEEEEEEGDEAEEEAEAEEEEESLSTPEPEPDTPFDFMRPLDPSPSPPTLAPLSFADLCQTPSPQTQTLPHFQFRFPAPQWRRCPTPPTTIQPWDDTSAWDGLITAFAGLHIGGQSTSDSNARAGPGFKSATTTVIPLRAPLSALVGCPRIPRSSQTLRRRTRHQFGRPSIRPGKIPALPSRFPSWCISEREREEEPVAKRRRCT